MKKLLFALVEGLIVIVLGLSLTACNERAPDLSKKEQDARLLGTWYNHDDNLIDAAKKATFYPNGTLDGLYPALGGKTNLFYTEGNCFLYVFVGGSGLKFSGHTHRDYYTIENDTLYFYLSGEPIYRYVRHPAP